MAAMDVAVHVDTTTAAPPISEWHTCETVLRALWKSKRTPRTWTTCCGPQAAAKNFTNQCFNGKDAIVQCCGFEAEKVWYPLRLLYNVVPIVGKRRGPFYTDFVGSPVATLHRLCEEFVDLPHITRKTDHAVKQCAYATYLLHRASVFGSSNSWEITSRCSDARLRERYSGVDDFIHMRLGICSERSWLEEVVAVFSQRPPEKLLSGMRDHSLRCNASHPSHVLYNVFAPEECFHHDPLLLRWLHNGSTAQGPEPNDRVLIDWIGMKTPRSRCHRFARFGHGQPELTRLLECRLPGPSNLLMMGEDYFESLSMLRAVELAASLQRGFVVFEVGSSYGYWGVKAALAWRQLTRLTAGPCQVVFVESHDEAVQLVPETLALNGIEDFCTVTSLHANATAELLDELVTRFSHVDLVHMDIQGAESSVLAGMTKLDRIRHLHVGTHSHPIHAEVAAVLSGGGFRTVYNHAFWSWLKTAHGPLLTLDGLISVERVTA
eukprot:TRINITY_DN47712_c0_g1_i1.p1 TRINITY_DN47712_c0_g1~~TRINITY_DN47712_c0_g1_i1.p1  ORF type:complete len:492 (+),score=64.38 TRINITY_DN47712_c0_g1_i1:134-1609(+)